MEPLFDDRLGAMPVASQYARHLSDALATQREALGSHAIYTSLDGLPDVSMVMEYHVFAVWDFMALLKALQRHLTSTDLFWRPVGEASNRRLINQMVLEEESDEIDGVPTSHFEVYLTAMQDVGADVGPITKLLACLGGGAGLEAAFERACVPDAARAFVRSTFDVIATGRPHMICAAFTCGREQAIPGIFQAVLEALPGQGDRLGSLRAYLERHIELDGEDHGPKAVAMLSALCGEDPIKWREAEGAARQALEARIALWSGIAAAFAHGNRRPSCLLPHAVVVRTCGAESVFA